MRLRNRRVTRGAPSSLNSTVVSYPFRFTTAADRLTLRFSLFPSAAPLPEVRYSLQLLDAQLAAIAAHNVSPEALRAGDYFVASLCSTFVFESSWTSFAFAPVFVAAPRCVLVVSRCERCRSLTHRC